MAVDTHSLFEQVVDQFEQNWSESSLGQISHLLAQGGLGADPNATAELARIDIQRRYAANLPVDFLQYSNLVPQTNDPTEVNCTIAYEDFRTRQAFDQPCTPERWAGVRGVEAKSWFQKLVDSQAFDSPTGGLDHAPAPVDCEQLHLPKPAVESVIRSLGFTPIRQIGQGAFSRVFLARQESLANRYVVIKAVQRCFDEAERLAELQHTNIVPIYSFHRQGQWSLLCMPYAGLVTLADYFDAIPHSNLRSGQSIVSTIQCAREGTLHRSEPLQPLLGQQSEVDDDTRQRYEAVSNSLTALHRDALAFWFFDRIVDALNHAHVRGILHGDIKPANLLIRNDGEPALLDFNLSQKFDNADLAAIGGTLPYMSPESLRSLMGSCSPISVESDIYSVGLVFYQFLTGRLAYPPPRSAAPIDLEVAIAQREGCIGWNDIDKVSLGIRAIIEKCLAPSISQRYQSARQLLDDLECERLNLPLKHIRERSLRHRISKWIARHPRVTSAASVLAAAMVIIAAMTLIIWRVAESREQLAAEQKFQRFEVNARSSLAGLLSIGRTGKAEAMENAKLCLDTYGIFDGESWQDTGSWNRLAARDKQTALALMANLMLRLSWNRIQNANSTTAENLQAKNLTSEDAIRSIKVLTQEPFVSQAPVAISLLSQAIHQPASFHSAPLKFDPQAIQKSSLSALDRIGLATRYIERGNGENALELLSANLLHQIDEYTYWITLGRAQMLMSDLRGAELSFSLAIESYPSSSVAFHYRGDCRMRLRNESDSRKAVADFTSALERQPDAFESLTCRAIAREALGDFKGAAKDLKELMEYSPGDCQALVIQSRVYLKQNDQLRSEQALEAALRSRPSTVAGWISRALARLPADKHGALRDLLHAQRLSPDSIEVLQNLAHVYSDHLDNPNEAITTLNRLLEINPEFELALVGRAVLHARCGHVYAALEDLDDATDAKGKLMPSSLYQASCVFAQFLNHSEEVEEIDRWKNNAFGYLSAALQQGFGANVFESDPDLAPLRQDERFQNAVAIIRAGQSFPEKHY